MLAIQDCDLSGKKVLIRVDFNVPLDKNQNIEDDSRIKATLKTIKFVLDKNASVILASHLGRPKDKDDKKCSLSPVAKRLSELLNKNVIEAGDCVGDKVKEITSKMKPGDIVLLENLRYHSEEKSNDENFAKELASLCDIYVNDAFAVCHRKHASVEAITRYAKQSAGGLLLQRELEFYAKAMESPDRPLVALIGGAKISSKLAALKNMLQHVDKIIIGGAMANTFLKSLHFDVGTSLVEDDLLWQAQTILKDARKNNVLVYLPVDAIVADSIDEPSTCEALAVFELPDDKMILDIGPATSILYAEGLSDARTIIWNGPMGVFEDDHFSQGTISMANCIASSDALTIVGGGDTDAALHKAGKADKVNYISTGGGAFLTLMEGKPLPAVSALEKQNK